MMIGDDTQISRTDSLTVTAAETTASWNRDPETTPVYAVVSAVAEASRSDPLDLPALANVIDPDALNTLFTSRSSPPETEIRFPYAGYDVIVKGEGTVHVYPQQEG